MGQGPGCGMRCRPGCGMGPGPGMGPGKGPGSSDAAPLGPEGSVEPDAYVAPEAEAEALMMDLGWLDEELPGLDPIGPRPWWLGDDDEAPAPFAPPSPPAPPAPPASED